MGRSVSLMSAASEIEMEKLEFGDLVLQSREIGTNCSSLLMLASVSS